MDQKCRQIIYRLAEGQTVRLGNRNYRLIKGLLSCQIGGKWLPSTLSVNGFLERCRA